MVWTVTWASLVVTLLHQPRYGESRRLFSDDTIITLDVDMTVFDNRSQNWYETISLENETDFSDTAINSSCAQTCRAEFSECPAGSSYSKQTCRAEFSECPIGPSFSKQTSRAEFSECPVGSSFSKQTCLVEFTVCPGASYAQCNMRLSESQCPTINACQVYTFSERNCFPGRKGRLHSCCSPPQIQKIRYPKATMAVPC